MPQINWLVSHLNGLHRSFYWKFQMSLTKMNENWNKIENASRGKMFLPIYILPFFAHFLGLTDRKKGRIQIFLISVNLCLCPRWSHEGKRNIPSKIWRGGQFSCFWGSDPLKAPLGPPGGPGVGSFHWSPFFGIGPIVFQEKNGGQKFYRPKSLCDSDIAC